MKPSTSAIQAWQTERAQRLHRLCKLIQAAIDRGQPLGKTIQRTARRWNGKPFRCDPSRRLRLSSASLRRFWDTWRRGGQIPAALRLNFTISRRLYAPALVRFVNLCSSQEFRSYKAAWQAFCARLGNRQSRPNYDTLHRALPPGLFKAFKTQWKAIRQAQIAIGRARLKFTAQIRDTVPDRPPSRRIRREQDFQI